MKTTITVSGIFGALLLRRPLALLTSQPWRSHGPSRPVTMVVAFAAGTTSDILARSLAQYLSETLGQSFVVDNRAGGGGNIGAAAVRARRRTVTTPAVRDNRTGGNQQADVRQHAVRSGTGFCAGRTCRQSRRF